MNNLSNNNNNSIKSKRSARSFLNNNNNNTTPHNTNYPKDLYNKKKIIIFIRKHSTAEKSSNHPITSLPIATQKTPHKRLLSKEKIIIIINNIKIRLCKTSHNDHLRFLDIRGLLKLDK